MYCETCDEIMFKTEVSRSLLSSEPNFLLQFIDLKLETTVFGFEGNQFLIRN